jgi:lysine-specific demethylase/histidyl-hydroxylase NO66
LREALPAGFAHDTSDAVPMLRTRMSDFKSWLDSTDLDKALERLGRRFWSSRTPFLAGHLEQLANLSAMSDFTTIRVRPNCSYYLSVNEDARELVLLLGDREVKMPGYLQTVVEDMLLRESFRVADLSEFLDQASRLTLCRRLVREGLFEAEHGTALGSDCAQGTASA